MSGLMFADDFVGISETPEGSQKQIEKALLIEYTIKLLRGNGTMTANVKKCAVVVCYVTEEKENPVTFEWNWGED